MCCRAAANAKRRLLRSITALAGSPASSNESGNGWSQVAFSPRTSGPSGSDAATSPDGSGRRPRTSRAVRQAFVAIR